MIRRAVILALLLASGCATSVHRAALTVPAEYRATVEAQRSLAAAQMAELGYSRPDHIRRVAVVPGTVMRPNGWAVPCKMSPTGYAGGWTESDRIVVVMDPRTRAIDPADVRHEFKHAILNANFFKGGLDAQHAEIARSERTRP